VFYARLTKWDEKFDHLPPHTIARQIYCTLTGPLSGMLSIHGHLLVDISETLDRKEAAIRCYKTQFPPVKENLFKRIDSAALYLGSTAGVKAAEMFTSPRPVVHKDLIASLFA